MNIVKVLERIEENGFEADIITEYNGVYNKQSLAQYLNIIK